MAVTFAAVSRAGALTSKRWYDYGERWITSVGETQGIVGWNAYLYLEREYGSYCAAAVFGGTYPNLVEPAAADISTAQVTVKLESEIVATVAVGVLTSELKSSASSRYDQIRANSNIIGTIAAGSTTGTFTVTRALAEAAVAYGVRVFPASEFGDTTSKTKIALEGTQIVYNAVNPAARGRVTDLTPGNYASIIAGESNTISYTYRHDAGGYAQAWLSVIASNQDTGAVVTICRKAAVSVADGARGSFTIPADTLAAGRWTLTICAAPEDSEDYYGNSSDFWTSGQTFTYVVRENPSSSSVTCDGRPVPVVSWVSTSQAAYQVRFGDYDSGARAGTETSFTVPRIFRDGAYPVQVRTASSAGDWSPWTDVVYAEIVNTEPGGDFSAEAAQDGVNMRVEWTPFADSTSGENVLTGDVVEITNGVGGDSPTQLSAKIVPVQAGSGTPSPTNIRAISGRTGAVFTRTNDVGGNAVTMSFDWTSVGTVYGGEIDALAGKLRSAGILKTLDGTESWALVGSGSSIYFRMQIASAAGTYRAAFGYCSHLVQRTISSSDTEPGFSFYYSSSSFRLTMRPGVEGITTAAQFKSWLAAQYSAGTPVQVVYYLVTPNEYDVTATGAITLLEGGNLVQASCGDVTIGYMPATETAEHYAVFRDGEMIAVMDDDAVQYVDRIGAGGEYEVLAVTQMRFYKSSGVIGGRLRLGADLISSDGGYTWLACRLTPEKKSEPEDIREDVTYAYYAGDPKPAAFRTHRNQRVKTFSYIFFTRAAARALRKLAGSEVLIKTTRGEHIFGVIGEMSWGDARQVTVSFSVREIRGEEDGLEYPT